MKRLIVVLFGIILFCLGGFTVSAQSAIYETAGDLYQAWYGNMPDYVCGVWSTDGGYTNLTFGIQDTDEGNRGKQEILNLIADDSTVSFKYQEYNLNYLYRIQDELFPYFEKDLGLVSSGVYEMENRVGIEVHKDYKNNPATIDMIRELEERYGDAIYIEYCDSYVTTSLEEKNSDSNSTALIFTVAASLLLTMIAAFTMLKFRSATLHTNTGTVVSSCAGYSIKAIECIVKESEVSVPSELDARIMGSIDKIK